ncbi:GerAB/ArcD/ProY family transporter [Salipaludibacillus sp. CF4.18]|uniref:GerAB/ArcD/ProY family transporter n=1 Tax=Salipaludibacillus sp. CF4.18 TaxID=3373081 RepID=UPI003EE4BDD7
MNLRDSDQKFGTSKLFVYTYCSTITLGVILLPYVGSEEIRSAWLKVILAVIPYLILLGLFHLTLKKQERGDLIEVFREKTLAIIHIPVILYLFISAVATCRWGIETLLIIVNSYLLTNTSAWIIVGYFLFIIFFSIIYGIEAIAKFLVTLFIMDIVIFITVIFLFFTEDFKWIYIPPVLSVDTMTFLKSSISDMSRYAGVVALLGFFPYMKNDVPFLKVSTISLLFVMITFSMVAIVVLGTFGFDQALTLLSPLTTLIQSVTEGTGIFERLDLIFLTIWLVSFYKISVIQIWFTSFLLKKLIPPLKKKDIMTKLLVVVSLFFLVILTPGYVNLDLTLQNMNLILYSFLVPSILCIFLIASKRGESQ